MNNQILFLLVLLVTLSLTTVAKAQFDVTDLPKTIDIYETVAYLDVASQDILANGYDSDTSQWTPFLMSADGSNLRVISPATSVQSSSLRGFLNDQGSGYIYNRLNGEDLKIYSFDNTGTAHEISIALDIGTFFFPEGVTDNGQLAASIGPEGGPFTHVLVSSTGEQQVLSTQLASYVLNAIGPDSLLGFNELKSSPPYVGFPSLLFNSQSNSTTQIDDAEIAAIVSPTKFWLEDSEKEQLWVRTNDSDTKKINSTYVDIFPSAEGGAFANDSNQSKAAYITSSLSKKTLTCAFPSKATSRKYERVDGVSGNKALVHYRELINGTTSDSRDALVTYNSKASSKSYCPSVALVQTKQCKLKRLTSDFYQLSKGALKRCRFGLRFSGVFVKGNTPVTLTVANNTGQIKKQVQAKNGILSVNQSLGDGAFSITLNAPKEGFKRYHSREIYIGIQ